MLSYLSAPFFPSKFLYDLTRNDGTNSISIIVQRWIERIQQHLRISIHYTERLHTALVKRANYLKVRSKSNRGCTMTAILSTELEIAVTPRRN